MYIQLVRFYADYYSKKGFGILISGVAISILSNLYKNFLRDGSIISIDEHPNKEKYNEIGLQYQTDKYSAEIVSQSAYALQLITSTD